MSADHRPISTKARLVVVLLAQTAAAILAAGAAMLSTAAAPELWHLVSAGLAVLGAFAASCYGVMVLGRHFARIERLRGAVLALAHDSSARLPAAGGDAGEPEIDRLHLALETWAGRRAAELALPDARLQAVLATVPDAFLVVTEAGQVSLVNHAARVLLGAERVAVGTSVYAALSRTSLRQAIERAVAAGRPVDTMIGTLEDYQLTAKVAVLDDHGGAVITIPSEEVEFRAELEADLALHDRPPPPAAFDDDTPLEALPIVVLDTETTGLDVARDRVVSIGAVRLAGPRIFRAMSFDRLIDPGMPIPPRSTAIHGITDAMVAGAPDFAKVFRDLEAFMAATVIVGHHIAFDLTIMKHECGRAGLDWPEPRSLCTLLLADALGSALPDHSLDGLAAWLGVDIQGRHTALGDTLVTAEVFVRLLPRLADRGVTTLGQAVEFSRRARRIIRAQAKAGW